MEKLTAVDLNVIASKPKAVWDGKSPLQYAVELDKLDVVNTLLNKGADVGFELPDQSTVLTRAATAEPVNEKMIAALVQSDPNSVLGGLFDRLGPGSSASSSESIGALITAGIDPNTLDKSGSTILETAVKKANLAAVTKILDKTAVVPVTEATRLKALAIAVQSPDLVSVAAVEQLLKDFEYAQPPPKGSPDFVAVAIKTATIRDTPKLLLDAGFAPTDVSWDALRTRMAEPQATGKAAITVLRLIQSDMVTAVVLETRASNPAATVVDINQKLTELKATVTLGDLNTITGFGQRTEIEGLRNVDGTLTSKGETALASGGVKRAVNVDGIETFYYESAPVTAEEEARHSVTRHADEIITKLTKAYSTLDGTGTTPTASDWAKKLESLFDNVLTPQDKAKFSISYTARADVLSSQDWAKTFGEAGIFYKDVPLSVNLGLEGSPKFPPGTANLAVDMFKMEKGDAATFSRHAKGKVESGKFQGNLELLVKHTKEGVPALRFNFHVDTVSTAQALNMGEFPSIKTFVGKDKSQLPLGEILRDTAKLSIQNTNPCIRKRDMDLAARALDPARIDAVLRESTSQVISVPLRRDLCDQDADRCAHAIFEKLRKFASSASVRHSSFTWQKMAAALEGSADAKTNLFRAIMNDVERAFYYEGKDARASVPLFMMPALTDVMRVY